jgi:hypothetical protein
MDAIIAASASCEVRAVIRFLHEGQQGNFFDRIHGTKDHSNVRGLL